MSDELYHHGVKGQKWGVRRYQNPDGSLTEEGYQHWGLNPDGSKFRGKKHGGYSDATVRSAKRGYAGGTIGGAIAGAAIGGPVGAMVGMYAGMTVGAIGGTAVGMAKTRRTQKKIRKMLKENGKVYVKDL